MESCEFLCTLCIILSNLRFCIEGYDQNNILMELIIGSEHCEYFVFAIGNDISWLHTIWTKFIFSLWLCIVENAF